VSSARVRGYLRTAETAAREGRADEAQGALRLADQACAALPEEAAERTELAVTRGEVAQWAADHGAAAAAFAEVAVRDRGAHRVDALATVRRMRAALAVHAVGQRVEAIALADQAVTLASRLGDDLQAEARAVRTRVEQASTPPPPRTPQPRRTSVSPPQTGDSGQSTEMAAGVDDLLDELDELVGLADVKTAVRELVALAQVAQARQAAGLAVGERTRNLAMVGAPGTGKTTVARLLGRIYGALGVVGQGQLIEVTRADLVAGFVGQTATRTNEACDRALGGVLFVDEAYSLVSGGSEDFGHEALAELVKRMEDDRGRLVVVLAGYPKEMEALIAANSGLRSRLQQTLVFADYGPADLEAIFDVITEREGWRLTDGARERAHATLAQMHAARGPDWANARTVRTFFETCLARHALRVTGDGVVHQDELDLVEEADVPDGDRP